VIPPRLVRRLVLAPLTVLVAVALAVLSPLFALLALMVGAAGRRRVLRLLFFVLLWLTAETAALSVCLGLWIASGFGGRLRTEPYQSRHYAVMERFLTRLYRAGSRAFRLRVVVNEPEYPRLPRPVIVLSRHAGPGDSFLLVHQLLTVYHRRPRVIMKAALQLDPSIDVVANRLPNLFISGHSDSEQIARLARGLDQTGALVLFPEGGNWTPGRWQRAIRRLERKGRGDLAARARQMPNLLPPQPGGALAAIAACPDADVIFVAHAGLDRLVTLRDVWRSLPTAQVIHARWWRVSAAEVPRQHGYDAQVRWLYDWWQRIDAWISANPA
jgi:1-acyl-sn-glycerol-3-phosphate acyltransferase